MFPHRARIAPFPLWLILKGAGDYYKRWPGQVLTLTAKNSITGDQVTQYVYGSTLVESGVARSDLLRAVIYPDSDDTASPLGNGPTVFATGWSIAIIGRVS